VDHQPTVKAALFLMNDETLLGWLKPEGSNLSARLAALSDANAMAEELYVATLSRAPTADESREVSEYLAADADRDRAVRNLIWSLLASNEFCSNH
jgi:hypothetical protein